MRGSVPTSSLPRCGWCVPEAGSLARQLCPRPRSSRCSRRTPITGWRARPRASSPFVKRVDERLVVLVDRTTLHFQRRSELTALDREIVLQQSDLLRQLEGRRACQLLSDFFFHLRLNRGHSEQLRAIGPDDVALHRPFLELIEVRNDEHRRKFALVSKHDSLRDVLVRFDFVLEWLRSDVLTTGGNDDVLLAVGDGEEAVTKLADIAGVKPAVGIHDFACRVGLVVVALHHVGTAGEYLAVGRDLHLDTVDRFSHGPDAEIRRRIYRYHG